MPCKIETLRSKKLANGDMSHKATMQLLDIFLKDIKVVFSND